MAKPSAEKLKLLQQLLKKKGIEKQSEGVIPRRTADGDAPLSFGQQRLWFLQQLDPGSSEYNDALVVRMRGHDVDEDVFRRCIAEVVRRHTVLRTAFVPEGGIPYQRVLDTLDIPLRSVDLRELTTEQQDERLEAMWREDVRGAFDLAQPPLIRTGLARLADDEYEFCLTMHHIVSDGVAYSIFFSEMTALYPAFAEGRPSPLTELPIQFTDYAQWERDNTDEATIRQKLPFWQSYLGGDLQPVGLPIDRPRSMPRKHDGAFVRLDWDDSLLPLLQEFCKRERVTSNWVLLATYFTLMYRYSGQTDLSIGTPSSIRSRTEFEQLIGFFVQTLILRLDLGGNPTFRQLIRRAQEKALEVAKYEDVPFDRIFQAVRPGVSATEAPLIQAWIAPMKNLLAPLTMPGGESSYYIMDPKNARFDVSLIIDETPDRVTGYWEYDTELFDEATIRRMDKQFTHLLGHVLRHPDTSLQLLRRLLREADGGNETPTGRRPLKKPMKKIRRRPGGSSP